MLHTRTCPICSYTYDWSFDKYPNILNHTALNNKPKIKDPFKDVVWTKTQPINKDETK